MITQLPVPSLCEDHQSPASEGLGTGMICPARQASVRPFCCAAMRQGMGKCSGCLQSASPRHSAELVRSL